MSVKAKFVVQSIEEFIGQKTVRMTPVYGNNDENKEWSKWTPSGKIEMTITNPDAANQFVIGNEYHVTFDAVVVE